MPELVDIDVSDLLLDQRNARLSEEQPSQAATALALAKAQGSRLVSMAEDIAQSGLDPTTYPAVVATGDQKKRYIVLEGNRRVLAIKALETPSLVLPALDSPSQKKLSKLANDTSRPPIETVACVLFNDEDEARHWIELRHTGQNDGVGLVEWGAEEKDRFSARHGNRSTAGQAMDFVKKFGALSEEAEASRTGVLTSLQRLLNTPEVRKTLGLDQVQGKLYAEYPLEEVAKSLSQVVDDLKTGRVKVGQIYHAPDRKKYADSFPRNKRPKRSTRLSTPVELDDLVSGATDPKPPPKRQRRKPKPSNQARTTVIPKNCHLNIAPPRINEIYNELLSLNLEQYPNASSVTMRVLIELSVDHYLDAKSLMSEPDRRNSPLAKRLKKVAAHLKTNGEIPAQLETAIKRVADGSQLLAASTTTWNQYVHNQFVFPKPSEVRTAWDELQPFMERLWP